MGLIERPSVLAWPQDSMVGCVLRLVDLQRVLFGQV
jgi:hypothetical protein